MSTPDEPAPPGPPEPNDRRDPQAGDEPFDAEILRMLPPNLQQLALIKSHSQTVAPPIDPIAEKLTPEHIAKLLELPVKELEMRDREADRRERDRTQARRYMLTFAVLGIAAALFLTVYLIGVDKELYKEVFIHFLTFIGGLGAGLGINKLRGSKTGDD